MCENLDYVIKTRKERRNGRNGTDDTLTDQNSILDDSGYVMDRFKKILNDLQGKDPYYQLIDAEKSCNSMISYFLKMDKQISKRALTGEIRSWLFNARNRVIEAPQTKEEEKETDFFDEMTKPLN